MNQPIFINYRRIPSKSDARNIEHELEKHFGEGSVFLDTQDVIPGDYWEEKIFQHLQQARVLLVLLPAGWLHLQDPESGKRRLDIETDWVRREIAFFLQEITQGVSRTIIPVLLEEGTTFPKKEHLPDALQGLAACQHTPHLRMENLQYDILQLVDAIKAAGIAGTNQFHNHISSIADAHPLPPLSLNEARRLPAPYVGLSHFKESEAHLYFGRDKDIADLINQIGQPDYRLCLLYGPSGVGKSSLLNAGLLPRIRQRFKIHGPERRSYTKGLDTQLQELLTKVIPNQSTLLILDQVEEMFTDANAERPQEATDFFRLLANTLRTPPTEVRLLLSFRFEHFTKIAQPLEDAGLQWLKLDLEPLTPRTVREAIEGVLHRAPLPERFNLKIYPEVIEMMVQSVCRDQESHIAPLLQLQLRSMWDEAVKLNRAAPVFDKTRYELFESIALPQMIQEQLRKLPATWQPALENGLVIGLLNRFVTERSTAGSVAVAELLEDYHHISDFEYLLECLQNIYLLIVIAHEQRFRLAHDALAPIIRRMHQDSERPGQRAARILEAKARDHARGYSVAFSEVDIEIVRAGQQAMPVLQPGVLAQLEQDERRYREARERDFRIAFEAAEKAVEHLEYPEALNYLEAAASYGIHLEKVHQLVHELPFFFAINQQTESLRASIALLCRVAPDAPAALWDENTEPERFLRELPEHDAALLAAMIERHFPTMLPIPGGKYEMGSEEGYADEKPVHTVTVDDFQLGATPVTCWQYGLFCLLTERELPRDSGFGRGDRPVVNVSWFDAVDYCNWLSERQGLKKAYTREGDDITINWQATGYRLPTEAEWEYAAREGGADVRFGNGKDVADPAEMNFDAGHPYNAQYAADWHVPGKGRGATTPVHTFAPNALGLYDMSGNVLEWCQDWWSEGDSHYYQQSEGAHNPSGPDEGQMRVVRGGSWYFNAFNCRCSYRYRYDPIVQLNDVGFRVFRRP